MSQFTISAPPGGLHISSFGGVLGFLPWQGVLPNAGAAPPQTYMTILDVMRAECDLLSFTDETTDSGGWGAQGNDVAARGFRCRARVKWDLRNPPNFLTANGAIQQQINFNLGYQFWYFVGSGLDYPSDLLPYYYYVPNCKGNVIQTIMDANAKKKVEANIEIISNSPFFALGGSVSEQVQLDLYIAHCRTRNYVF